MIRIERMLRKRGLNLDDREHDEASPSKKRRRRSNDLDQTTVDNLVAATMTWLEDEGNRLFKTKGKGPNALAMARKWKDAMIQDLDDDVAELSGWADDRALYNFVTVSKEAPQCQEGRESSSKVQDNKETH